MGVVWSMLEVSNWEEERCPDRSNRPPVASKSNATATIPKNTATSNAIIKNNAAKNNAPKNNAAKNTNTTTKNAKNTNTTKAATVLHAAATKSAANNTAGV